MGYLQKFVSYQAQRGNDVVDAIRKAGASFRIVGEGITSPDNLGRADKLRLRADRRRFHDAGEGSLE
jgi:hypothetical protein